MISAVSFVDKFSHVFVRPFPQLGTFLGYLARKILTSFYFETQSSNENLHKFLANLLFDFYEGHDTNNVSLYEFFSWGSIEEVGTLLNM